MRPALRSFLRQTADLFAPALSVCRFRAASRCVLFRLQALLSFCSLSAFPICLLPFLPLPLIMCLDLPFRKLKQYSVCTLRMNKSYFGSTGAISGLLIYHSNAFFHKVGNCFFNIIHS